MNKHTDSGAMAFDISEGNSNSVNPRPCKSAFRWSEVTPHPYIRLFLMKDRDKMDERKVNRKADLIK